MSFNHVKTVRARLSAWFSTLTQPHPSIKDPEVRWLAQIFNGLILPLAGLTIIGAVVILLRGRGSPWPHAISVVLLLAGLALGRTRHVALAGVLAVLGFAEPCFVLPFEKATTAPADVGGSMTWLAEALVFSALALPMWRSILLNAGLLAAQALVASRLPPHPELNYAWALSFLSVFFLLTVVTSVVYQRARQGFFGQMREREKAEREAHESSETLGAVLSSSPAAVLLLDLDGTTTMWNPAAERLFGWTREEIIGKANPVLALGQIFDAGRPFGLTRRSQPHAVRELEVPKKSGELVTVSLSTAPLLDVDGAPSGIIGVAVDVSARKQLEAELRHAQKMEAVGRLAGGVAHDFNNLLTIINGNTEVVRADLGACHPMRPMIDEVAEAGHRAVSLTRQLLAFSRKQVVHIERLDLGEVVSSMTKMVRRLIGPSIELEHKQDNGIWAVEADRGQLEQIVLNLVVNASDAMPSGGRLTMSCSNGRYDPRGLLGESSKVIPRAVVLTVSDTGVGISKDVKERIFEPFFTTKDPGKGTGLGLSTVYGIVTNAGAAIEVESEPDVGTTFRIYWPACTSKADARVSTAPQEERGNGELILVVDDMGSIRALVGRLLTRLGYRVLLAESTDEALALCEAHAKQLDAAVVDLILPGASGPICARKLRERCPALKVLFMTGQVAHASSLLSQEDAGLPLLEKPFGLRALGKALRLALRVGALDRPTDPALR